MHMENLAMKFQATRPHAADAGCTWLFGDFRVHHTDHGRGILCETRFVLVHVCLVFGFRLKYRGFPVRMPTKSPREYRFSYESHIHRAISPPPPVEIQGFFEVFESWAL